MKTIAKAWLSNNYCSVQEAELYFARIKAKGNLSADYFVNTNLLGERHQVLPPGKKLSKLPANSLNISKRSNIDYFMERPSGTFCNGSYRVLNGFCYRDLLGYFTLEKNII